MAGDAVGDCSDVTTRGAWVGELAGGLSTDFIPSLFCGGQSCTVGATCVLAGAGAAEG